MFFQVGVQPVVQVNHIVSVFRVTSDPILISAWIGWTNTESDWTHSLDLALFLSISFVIRLAVGHFFLGGRLVNLHGHLSTARSASQLSIRNIKISNDDIFNVLFSQFLL